MKKFILAIAICYSLLSNATVRTVSNNPATIAQFNTIQAAVDASSSGDTILVHGSPTHYGVVTVTNKKLTIIGAGWSPLKQMPLTTKLQTLHITGTASTGTEIQGIEFVNGGGVVVTSNHPDSVRFIRNYFIRDVQLDQFLTTTYKGFVFEGNVFSTMAVRASASNTYQDFIFRNNYFHMIHTTNANIDGFVNSVNVLFDHNLWFGPSSGSGVCFSSNCAFLTLTNNIFVRRDAAVQNSQSTFNNNITFGTSNNTPWAVNNNIDGGGNVANQDPQMVDQASVNAGINNPLLNFTIAAGPANNSGSDGKDMGLLYDLTGSLNWTNTRTSRLPYVFSMNITNPTIATGGTLNVQVEARKSN